MIKAIKLNYLYRDASNYKSWGEVIFANPEQISVNRIDALIRNNIEHEELFIAHEVGIPELFSFIIGSLTSDDHCYHEYNSVEEIEIEREGNLESIDKFIKKIMRANSLGWPAFDPLTDLDKIRKRAGLHP